MLCLWHVINQEETLPPDKLSDPNPTPHNVPRDEIPRKRHLLQLEPSVKSPVSRCQGSNAYAPISHNLLPQSNMHTLAPTATEYR